MIAEIFSTIINLVGTLVEIIYIFGAAGLSATCEYEKS